EQCILLVMRKFGNAAGRRGHRRDTCSHRLEQGDAEALTPRWEGKGFSARKKRWNARSLDCAQEADAGRQTEIGRLRLKLPALRSIPCKHQGQIPQRVRSERLDQD